MSDIKKIELALSDLTTALAEHAEYRANKSVNERLETWHNLFQGIAQRVQNLESAAGMVAEELKAAHRRIADLEVRVEDLERDLGELSTLDNTRRAVADMINDGDIRLHVD